MSISAQALRALGARGVTRVFSEGGPRVAARLIALGLADEVVFSRRTSRSAGRACRRSTTPRAPRSSTPRAIARWHRRSTGPTAAALGADG